MIKRHHYSRKKLIHILSKAKYNPVVIRKITYPYEAKSWSVYRRIFMTDQRIQNGVLYWKMHQKALQYANRKYHIPIPIIIAIIAVETRYGTVNGHYRTLDVLNTLAFYYRPRQSFFRSELEAFLLLCQEQHLPLFSLTGSYAGALGIPQFMPSTYRSYAVKYDPRKPLNLLTNHSDAIVSIAHFLQKMGWHANQLIAVHCQSKNSSCRSFIRKNTENPQWIQLNHLAHQENWLIFHNFAVIMRYNPHINYTMIVYQLSQAIKNRYDHQHVVKKSIQTTAARETAGSISVHQSSNRGRAL